MNVDFPHEIKGLWIPNTRSTDFISASLLSANLTSSSWCASAQLEPKLMWILIWCRHHISTWLISNHWQFSANKDHIWCFQSCLVATFQKYSSLRNGCQSVACLECALVSLVREGHQHLHLGPHLPRVVSAEPRRSHKQARTGPPVHSYVHKFICTASSKFAISY